MPKSTIASATSLSPDRKPRQTCIDLTRAYRCRAELTNGDVHLIVTDGRARAITYLGLFADRPHYAEAHIELGSAKYTKANLESMP